MAPVISLVTCTHNPSAVLFNRTLVAVAALKPPPGYEIEYVIIDNASTPSVRSRVAEFPALKGVPWARIIEEPTPGVAEARRLGTRETKGDLIIAIDDDVELAPDYLIRAIEVARDNPRLGVFGAGVIRVEFTDPVPAWISRDMRVLFQERTHSTDEFGAPHGWISYCPFGTGLVTRRSASQRWSDAMGRGELTLVGRTGSRMLSGEDAQIIFSAVAAGELIGVTPKLHLTHLIPARRCTARYIRRLEYGLSVGLRIALAECFPGDRPSLGEERISLIDTLRNTAAVARARGLRQGGFELARQLGGHIGALEVAKRPQPFWLRTMISLLGVAE